MQHQNVNRQLAEHSLTAELPLPESHFRAAGVGSRTTFFRWEKAGLQVLRIGNRRFIYAAELIAYEAPLYQVLSLEPAMGRAEPPAPRTAETLSMSEALRRMFEAGGTSESETIRLRGS